MAIKQNYIKYWLTSSMNLLFSCLVNLWKNSQLLMGFNLHIRSRQY